MKTLIVLGCGLIAGFALSWLSVDTKEDARLDPTTSNSVGSVECVCDLQQSGELNRALEGEREANDRLRAEIERLHSVVELMEGEAGATWEAAEESSDGGDWLEKAWADLAFEHEPPDRRRMLIDAGFATARAEWILSRESELQLAALNDHHRDVTGAQSLDYLEFRLTARDALREEIGDFEYERYLAAIGQSTAVAVTQVLADSPAQASGLQVGDEIVDYGGTRVFNMIDLADNTRNGDRGEAVIINIERNGAPMQLVVPRGPLGISGGKPIR